MVLSDDIASLSAQLQKLTIAVSNLVLARTLQGSFDVRTLPRENLIALKLDYLLKEKHQLFDESPEADSCCNPVKVRGPNEETLPVNDLGKCQLNTFSSEINLKSTTPFTQAHQVFDDIPTPSPCTNSVKMVKPNINQVPIDNEDPKLNKNGDILVGVDVSEPHTDHNDLVKPTVSHLPTASLCNHEIKESQFASLLSGNDTTLSAHQVFDSVSDPNSYLNIGISVNSVEIDLVNTRATSSVSHPACHGHNTINNIESIVCISCDITPETKDGTHIRDAHEVLDEMPLPDFIREMAANTTPAWNSIERGYKFHSDIIQKVDSLAYERQLFPKLSADNILDKMSQPVLSLRQNLIAPSVMENTLVSHANEVGVVGKKILSVPPMRSEEQLVALVEDDNNLVDDIRKLPMAIDDILENHLIVCCEIAINKTVNSFPFDPGELNYNPSIFKTLKVVSTDQQGDVIVAVWVFDPGGYCDLLRVSSANMVMRFRGNIKKSTAMVNLDPCANDQELRKNEQLDCILEGAYGSCRIFVFDSGGSFMIYAIDEAPVHFQDIGHSLNPSNDLILKVLSASPSAYSSNPTKKLSNAPSLTGSSISLVSEVQARNNARVLISGSLNMFSDRFLRSAVQKAGSSTGYGKSGNEQFVTELTKWILHERGHLKAVNVRHNKIEQAEEPSMYKIADDLEYAVEIYEWFGKSWEPYVADDVQLQFYMISPYMLKTLSSDKKGPYFTSFKVPDVYWAASSRVIQILGSKHGGNYFSEGLYKNLQCYVFDPGGQFTGLVIDAMVTNPRLGMCYVMSWLKYHLSLILEDKDHFKGPVMIHTDILARGSLVILPFISYSPRHVAYIRALASCKEVS